MRKFSLYFLLILLAANPWIRAQDPPTSSRTFTYGFVDFGEVPRAIPTAALVRTPLVQKELKTTASQKEKQEAVAKRFMESLQQARAKTKNTVDFLKARDTALTEMETALLETLEPTQLQRVKEIELQTQGFLAFAQPQFSEQLALTKQQVEAINAIVAEAQKNLREKEFVTLGQESPERPATLEAIQKWVDLPETRAAIEKGRESLRAFTSEVTQKIEKTLTETQRATYHQKLGAPFEFAKEKTWDPVIAARNIAAYSGLLGQRADPDFNTKVAHPAYTQEQERPKVLFDEAHHNFHTAGGRYKPFADLITHDGYRVDPNRGKFTKDVLEKGSILIIANALGAEEMGQPNAEASAFTDEECDAVRDWVENGGALLLITDHHPMGPAAEILAKRLKVDMGKNTTIDPENCDTRAPSCLIFARSKGLLGDHPIMRGRNESETIQRVMTFTGQSLQGPEGSVPLLKLADSAKDRSFPNDTSAAGRSQGLAFRLGKGRVVVLGEAGQLSAQIFGASPTQRMGMNVPGTDNRQFALNIMHWLSGLLDQP